MTPAHLWWIRSGGFNTVGGVTRNNLAAVSTTGTGAPTAWDPSPLDAVVTVSATADAVYAGGRFSAATTFPQTALAAVDAATGQLTSGVLPCLAGGQTSVRSMDAIGNTLYIGGVFTQVGTSTRVRLAGIDTTTGNVTGFAPSPNVAPIDLDHSGTTLYAAGFFSTIGSPAVARDGFAAIDTTTSGTALPWDPEVNGASAMGIHGPQAIAVGGDSVYIAGDFETVKGASRYWAAAVDPVTAAAKPWNPDPNALDGNQSTNLVIKALLPAGETVYISGDFRDRRRGRLLPGRGGRCHGRVHRLEPGQQLSGGRPREQRPHDLRRGPGLVVPPRFQLAEIERSDADAPTAGPLGSPAAARRAARDAAPRHRRHAVHRRRTSRRSASSGSRASPPSAAARRRRSSRRTPPFRPSAGRPRSGSRCRAHRERGAAPRRSATSTRGSATGSPWRHWRPTPWSPPTPVTRSGAGWWPRTARAPPRRTARR